MSIEHYENFPVASLLCPPALRAPIAAIYHFARTADDLADEGVPEAAQRLADLASFRNELQKTLRGEVPAARWQGIFLALRAAVERHPIAPHWLEALLDAFEQDARNPRYANQEELLDYCARSANPIGRLLLRLYGIDDDASLHASDAICTGLQLANFWQDLSIDLARDRIYLPMSDLQRHGLSLAEVQAGVDNAAFRALVAEEVSWARGLLREGSALVHRVPGRAGWELRLVVQGGLRILERIEQLDYASRHQRPVITRLDWPLLGWRALWMRPGTPFVAQGIA